MAKFYFNFGWVSCGNGCNASWQALIFDEYGNPLDTDWDRLTFLNRQHGDSCSVDSPNTTDSNCFYGDPNSCAFEADQVCNY